MDKMILKGTKPTTTELKRIEVELAVKFSRQEPMISLTALAEAILEGLERDKTSIEVLTRHLQHNISVKENE
jgi:ribosome biogenesis protein Nip4